MSDPEGRSQNAQTPPDAASRRRRRRLRSWRRWLITGREGAHDPPSSAPPAPSAEGSEPAPEGRRHLDLVDQAEAFATLRVSDVMTPRADVVALDITTPLSEVVARFVEVELTRMPLFRDTLDDPVGVVHIKDVVKLIAPAATGGTPPWGEPVLHRIRRELLYVPASMRTADLLVRMRAQRIHMAMVIDEFGGADGLVTLEDLIEEVVGEIDDEHDEAYSPDLVERPGGLIEADARTPLEDLEARLGMSLHIEGEEHGDAADTVAGLVAELAGRLPQRGEVIVHPKGVEFEVMEADPRRIRRLRVRPVRLEPESNPGPGDDEAAAFLPDPSAPRPSEGSPTP
ncbi:hypothetical protein BH09PSE2_BH09PSE2_03980 [soil metagenome]